MKSVGVGAARDSVSPTLLVSDSTGLCKGRDRPGPDFAALHAKCAVYTRPNAVRWFLDAVGWTAEADLAAANLLEPAAGDGAFLVEAVDRLCSSFRKYGKRRTYGALASRIRAYEIHPMEADRARQRVTKVLRRHGLSATTAVKLANEWIGTEDFLVVDFDGRTFTHVVGNPPYVRWSRVPEDLRKRYERSLPAHAAKGDLCLAFVSQAMGRLADDGRLGFLCSDRWLYSGYAEEFRHIVLPEFVIECRKSAHGEDVFDSPVDSYPIKLIARRRKLGRRRRSRAMTGSDAVAARRTYENWRRKYPTLEEAGCRIRVGPALGPERAFVGMKDEIDVEPELLRPYVGPKELTTDGIAWRERYVICMHDDDGKLRDLGDFPRLAARMKRFRADLSARAIVRNGAPWYRPIDRVIGKAWSKPKILIPEMSKTPRVVVDRSGMIPSHGIYAIFSDEWPIEALAAVLRSGVLWTTLEAIAPRTKGGHLRAYARFLKKIPLAAWSSIPADLRCVLKTNSWGVEEKKHSRSTTVYDIDLSLSNPMLRHRG